MSFFINRIIWITGASSGIGESLAYALSKEGATLILSARREDELMRVQKLLAHPEKSRILTLDLENNASLESKTQEAISLYGRIDVMAHNGGISQRSLAIETPIEIHKKVMEIDYFSYVTITNYLLPHFIERKSGHIVVMSSVMGKLETPMRSSYAAAKHALHGYFDCLRAEVWKEGITVTMLTPGFIQTNITKNSLNGKGEKRNEVGSEIGNGYPPELAAIQIMKAIRNKKREVFIGKKYRKEQMGLFMKRFFPGTFAKIARKLMPN
jgi:short-subunit dehydrogenase